MILQENKDFFTATASDFRKLRGKCLPKSGVPTKETTTKVPILVGGEPCWTQLFSERESQGFRLSNRNSS
jgi:hypothetical protein